VFVKILGAVLILVSGSSVGWLLGSSYLNRVREIKELQLAINIIDSEMNYGQVLLPDALKTAAKLLKGSTAALFLEASKELENSAGELFTEIWVQKLEKYYHQNNLLREDINILSNWGQQLGISSLREQKNINKKSLRRLEQQEEIAREISRKRVKLVRYAGVLLSLLVIILFY